MSNEQDKLKHGTRLHRAWNAIKKQLRIAKAHGNPTDQPHRYAKHHAMDCGDSNCVMCGNPRKFFGEKTIQEQRFDQDVDNLRDKHSNGLVIKED